MALHIIADSACDLPKEIIKEFNLKVLPLSCTIDGVDYLDGVDMQPKQLMDMMRNGARTKTSQVPAYKFFELFEEYAKAGDTVIYIAFSSGLSGTYNSGMLAKDDVLEKYPDFDITVIDTRSASMGYGLIVYKALTAQRDGAGKDEIIQLTQHNIQNIEHIFTVDDLEYLFRGGRVSRTAALVGGLLGIKPVMDMNETGHLCPMEKARGRKAAIKRLAEIAGIRGTGLDKQVIGISHGDDMGAVEQLKKHMTDMYGCTKFIVNSIGCAIGAHAGPGTLALFFVDKEYA